MFFLSGKTEHTIGLNTVILLLIGGLMLTASFPKTGADLLAWVAFVPFFIAVEPLVPRQAFFAGVIFGLVHYLTLLYWVVYTMNTYGYVPLYLCVPVLFLLSAYLSLYVGIFGMVVNKWLLSLKWSWQMLIIASLWVALEYARAMLLTGFPWELLGYSQYKRLELIQIADISGVYGISFFILAGNIALFQVWRFVRDTKIKARASLAPMIKAMICFLVLLTGVLGYGAWRIQDMEKRIKDSGFIRAAAVQGNISQDLKWDKRLKTKTVKKYISMSLSSAPERPELVVWPETAAPFYFEYETALRKRILRAIRQSGMNYIIGSPHYEKEANGYGFYNSAYLIDSGGKVAGRYDKVHLVPFGEYVPLKKWLPFLGKMVEQVGDFKPGEKGDAISLGGHRMGMLICYEIIFPGLSRAMGKNGAELLINITNDAWFGKTSAPFQHFSMAVFRAIENKRALVRSANTGISGFIDPVGRVMGTTSLFEETVMTQSVPAMQIRTFYTRYGDIFAYLCIFITIIFLAYRFQRRFYKNDRRAENGDQNHSG